MKRETLKGPLPGSGSARQWRHIDVAVTVLSAEYYTDVNRENSWKFYKKLALSFRGASRFRPAKMASHVWHFNVTQVIQCTSSQQQHKQLGDSCVKNNTISKNTLHSRKFKKEREKKRNEEVVVHDINIKWVFGSDMGEGRSGMSVAGTVRGSWREPLPQDG